ncbi:MAG: HEAT repeat domain-containing protein [Nitrospira sp.]|nr:HEAT repeat domain-containing protein [Nitrospira sp.]
MNIKPSLQPLSQVGPGVLARQADCRSLRGRLSVDWVCGTPYDAVVMIDRNQRGQARLTAVFVLVGLIVTGVWVWKRIPPDTKDILVEHTVPITLLGLAGAMCLWLAVSRIRRGLDRRAQRERLIARFERATGTEQRLELAFALIELNRYRLKKLERVAPAMRDLFMATLKTALGDKQHRVRGMAASHLGVLRDKAALPLLLAALEDDHAYVRACAALALGRMRAGEATERLTQVMQDDWDQTVRSRAREALERIP